VLGIIAYGILMAIGMSLGAATGGAAPTAPSGF
jgi:hypothetical protein